MHENQFKNIMIKKINVKMYKSFNIVRATMSIFTDEVDSINIFENKEYKIEVSKYCDN